MVNFYRTKKKIQLQQEPARTPQAYISQQRGRGNESLQASLRAAEFWGDDWLNTTETTATAAVLRAAGGRHSVIFQMRIKMMVRGMSHTFLDLLATRPDLLARLDFHRLAFGDGSR